MDMAKQKPLREKVRRSLSISHSIGTRIGKEFSNISHSIDIRTGREIQ